MSSDKLPRSLEVKKLADLGATLSGTIAVTHLTRVSEAVFRVGEAIAVELSFARGDDGKSTIDVCIDGLVDLICQRCLEPVAVTLNTQSTLTVVAHEAEADAVLKMVDPIVLEEGRLDVYSLVEDEVLLALPIVAMHQQNDIVSEVADVERGADEENESSAALSAVTRRSDVGADNPFQVLKTLKLKTSSQE